MKKILPLALLLCAFTTPVFAGHLQWWELIDPTTPFSNHDAQAEDDEFDLQVQDNLDDDEIFAETEVKPPTRLEKMRQDYRRKQSLHNDVQTGSLTPAKPKKSLPISKQTPNKVVTQNACQKGAAVVTSFGFETVVPKTCEGAILSFDATRGGKVFEVTVVAKTGELGTVKMR